MLKTLQNTKLAKFEKSKIKVSGNCRSELDGKNKFDYKNEVLNNKASNNEDDGN